MREALYAFQQSNFCRCSDWRWHAALELAAFLPSRQNQFEIDAEVSHVVGYLQAGTLGSCRRPFVGPSADYTGLARAHMIYDGAGNLKVELEARLLAGESDTDIAARCELSEAVVVAYERAFFAVRAHLKARDWIQVRAIGTRISIDHPGLMLKFLAYHGGSIVLDSALAVMFNRALPVDVIRSFTIDPVFEEERHRLQIRLVIDSFQSTTYAELVQVVKEYRQAAVAEKKNRKLSPVFNMDTQDNLKTPLFKMNSWGALKTFEQASRRGRRSTKKVPQPATGNATQAPIFAEMPRDVLATDLLRPSQPAQLKDPLRRGKAA